MYFQICNLLDLDDLLPHPTTVSRRCQDRADELRLQLASELQEALSRGKVGFTTDIWVDNHRKIPYSAITAHWVCPLTYNLISRLVCCDPLDCTQKKTGVNVRAAILKSFARFSIDESLIKNAVFSTDRGSNIILALTDDERMDCANHVLNTILRHTLDSAN